MIRSLRKRFWEKVDKRGPDECWEWTGGKISGGYGQIRDEYSGPKTRVMLATHASLRLHGVLLARELGYHVLHSCDRPSCVSPAHLRVGTAQDNMDDKVKRGRVSRMGGPRGATHPNAKLSDADVLEIREKLTLGMEGRVIAREYGVTESSVSMIKHNRTWKSVTS